MGTSSTTETKGGSIFSGLGDALGFGDSENRSGIINDVANFASAADRYLDTEAPGWLNAISYALPVFGTYRGVQDAIENRDAGNIGAAALDTALIAASLIPGLGGIYGGLTKGAVKGLRGMKGAKVLGKEGEAARNTLQAAGRLDEGEGALEGIMRALNGEAPAMGAGRAANARLAGANKGVDDVTTLLNESRAADEAAAAATRDARAALDALPTEEALGRTFDQSVIDASRARGAKLQAAEDARLAEFARIDKDIKDALPNLQKVQAKAAANPGKNSKAVQAASNNPAFNPDYRRTQRAAARNTEAEAQAAAEQELRQAIADARTARDNGYTSILDARGKVSSAEAAERARQAASQTAELVGRVASNQTALAQAYEKALNSQRMRDAIVNLLFKDRRGSGILGKSLRQVPYGMLYTEANPYFIDPDRMRY